MRSRNASPGFAETSTSSQSESTCVPPVTELRSPPLSRITGALSPVMALSLTEATPSITSPSAGTKSPASTSTTSPLRRLGLAAPLGHRLREVGEEHGEPEPKRDTEDEAGRRLAVASVQQGLQPEQRGQDGAHVDHEHHGIPHLPPRGKLLEGIDRGLPDDGQIEERTSLGGRYHDNLTWPSRE